MLQWATTGASSSRNNGMGGEVVGLRSTGFVCNLPTKEMLQSYVWKLCILVVLSLNAGKSHMLPIIHDLWYWYISYIVHHKLKFTLDFSGGAQGRSFGAIYTWDGALSTEARDACSVEQRFIIALFYFLSLICMYHLFSLHHLFYLWCAGVVELLSDFVVCEEGKPLSPESARILVRFLFFIFYFYFYFLLD